METKMIGKRIAEARKKLSISQAQIAEKLFISSQAVGKWERGESMPDITTLIRLAEILGVDLNYFSKSIQFEETETTIEEAVNNEKSDEINNEKRNWNMSGGNWENADFSGLNNLQEKFGFSNIKNCKFIGSDMSGLILKANNVDSCDFSNSDFSNCKIQASQVTNNEFKNSLLKTTEFIGCV